MQDRVWVEFSSYSMCKRNKIIYTGNVVHLYNPWTMEYISLCHEEQLDLSQLKGLTVNGSEKIYKGVAFKM